MSRFSKTQYDSFSTAYDNINDLPISRVIVPNVERLVQPLVKNGQVLELACGSGFFTRHLLDWGAKEVVGVDVSQAMLDIAKSENGRDAKYSGRYQLMLQDCSAPFTITDEQGQSKEGKFDLVFAAWFLNYAPDLATMTEMFRNISRHLRPGGRFITILPHPEDDPMICINHVNEHQKMGYGYRIEVLEPLSETKGGYHVHLYFDTDPIVDFGNYYLPKTVHEQAAKDGGMTGALKWEEVIVPEHEVLNGYMKDPISKGYLDEWAKYPDFGILVVEKE